VNGWKDRGKCHGQEVNIFFDIYEANPHMRQTIDKICLGCPVLKDCFSEGVSNKEWGVWGGVYLEDGDVSKEFNDHKTRQEWIDLTTLLTHEKE